MAFLSFGVGRELPRVDREDRRVPTIGCVVCAGWRDEWGVSRTRKGVVTIPLCQSYFRWRSGVVDWTCMDWSIRAFFGRSKLPFQGPARETQVPITDQSPPCQPALRGWLGSSPQTADRPPYDCLTHYCGDGDGDEKSMALCINLTTGTNNTSGYMQGISNRCVNFVEWVVRWYSVGHVLRSG